MAQRAEAIVYTISTNVSGTKGAGDKVLERIADATGGRAFFPFQIRDVSNDFAEIQDELRSQYAMSYKPADSKRMDTTAPSKSSPMIARIFASAPAAVTTPPPRSRPSSVTTKFHEVKSVAFVYLNVLHD